jgi:hypothetical protein
MKKLYEPFFEDEPKYIKAVHGRYIIDTKHSLERKDQQRGYTSSESFEVKVVDVINKGIEKILTEYHDESTTYGIWSKSTGVCAIIEWRMDYKKTKDKTNQAIIITIPPIKKNASDFHIHSKDIRIIVENALHRMVMKKLQEEHRDIDRRANALDFIKFDDHTVTYHEGKMWDSGIAFCIEVE